MKKFLTVFLACLAFFQVQAFDRTLRVDYIFSGDCKSSGIALAKMSVTDGWYGRSVNMDKVPVAGNGGIRMTDDATGKVLYANSFSTLSRSGRLPRRRKR